MPAHEPKIVCVEVAHGRVSPAGIEPALSARKAVVLPLDDGDMLQTCPGGNRRLRSLAPVR